MPIYVHANVSARTHTCIHNHALCLPDVVVAGAVVVVVAVTTQVIIMHAIIRGNEARWTA